MNLDNDYYSLLNTELRKRPYAVPALVIDLDILDHNISKLLKVKKPDLDFRIVVKSLPVPKLVDYIRDKCSTDRLMVFHLPFLFQIAEKADEKIDVCWGKPMPAKNAKYFYEHVQTSKDFDPYRQISWLVDTLERLQEYIEVGRSLGRNIPVLLEIDVGLHRGGFNSEEQMRQALEMIQSNNDAVSLAGMMGYDAHVGKVPSIVEPLKKSFQRSCDKYTSYIELLKQEFAPMYRPDLIFNGGGSPTMHLHSIMPSPINDVCAGSCLVKPSDFDLPSLDNYTEACFIATPVLKKFEGTELPALERWKGLLNMINATNRNSYFIYGGKWKADICYPADARTNKIFGASTNQSMINTKENLEVEDYIFMRPHQSEFVFLQFGPILIMRDGKVVDEWSVFGN